MLTAPNINQIRTLDSDQHIALIKLKAKNNVTK
jgi:hypothetical protein